MDFRIEFDKYLAKKKGEFGTWLHQLVDKEKERLMPKIETSNREQIDFLSKLFALMCDDENELLAAQAEAILCQVVDIYKEAMTIGVQKQVIENVTINQYDKDFVSVHKKIKKGGAEPDWSKPPVLKAKHSDPVSAVGGTRQSERIGKALIKNQGEWYRLDDLSIKLGIHRKWFCHLRPVLKQKLAAADYQFSASKNNGGAYKAWR